MIDIELIRTAFDETSENLAKRGVSKKTLRELQKIDENWRILVGQTEEARAAQNDASREIGEVKGDDKKERIKALQQASKQLKELEQELAVLNKARSQAWKHLPNLVADDVPVGKGEVDNKVLRNWGEVPQFAFEPKEHWELGRLLGVIDTEKASQIAGARFTYLFGPLVQLQFALMQFAVSVLTNEKKLEEIAQQAGMAVSTKPFLPVVPPVFIRPEVLDKMARLEPRDERYYLPSDDLFLVGSAEHTLGPLHMNETLEEQALPKRYVGYSTSFRREAGSYGKDTKGILRLHQFDKLEIESFTTSDESIAEQNFIVAIQEYLMQQLKLPYQVVANATGDISDPDARQIDIEAWLPGQNKYRETHTSDLMTDYQARRLNTRVKREGGKTEYVHMNDATVFAMGRTLISIMENNQQADGTIVVPEVLRGMVGFDMINKVQ